MTRRIKIRVLKKLFGGVLLLRMKWFVVLLATTVLLLSLSLTAVATPDPVISEIMPVKRSICNFH